MAHHTNGPAEYLLDKEIKVLDHGFLRLVDYMGSDQRIVDAARVSYQAATKKVNSDEQLLRYLLRHFHTTPFEKVRFEFHVKLPIFVARQWMRHRMGSYNEESARYSVMKDEFYLPTIIRKQGIGNKQGGDEALYSDVETMMNCISSMEENASSSYNLYKDYLADGMSRELARTVLPVSLYTEFYWTVDLWNLMHFLRLRADNHAQLEIRVYAQELVEMARAVCPQAISAWEDYIFYGERLSSMEVATINNALGALKSRLEPNFSIVDFLEEHAKMNSMATRTPSNAYSREFVEFLEKFDILCPTT